MAFQMETDPLGDGWQNTTTTLSWLSLSEDVGADSSSYSTVGVRCVMNFSELLTCGSSGIECATLGTWEILL